jgi:hypothetical protein
MVGSVGRLTEYGPAGGETVNRPKHFGHGPVAHAPVDGP